MNYLSHLECSQCKCIYPTDQIQTYCLDCQAPLLVRYDLISARSQLHREMIAHRRHGMWRWKELLPLHEEKNIISLGEGDTPLLHLPRLGKKVGLKRLYVKDEGLNPTGTFKARGISSALSKAYELGINRFIIPTAGNAGGALATYAARASLEATICTPVDTPEANLAECRAAGAKVILVDGLISDAATLATEKARTEGWFDLSTFKEPYRTEGKKVMGYELAEAFYWQLPDVIIYPTGGGTGLVGIWKAFAELMELGWLETNRLPRLVAVQAEGCAPVIKSFFAGREHCEYWKDAKTLASGLRVPKSFADRLILTYLRESEGHAIAVSDESILEAQRSLWTTEGLCASPEGAATFAAIKKLVSEEWISPDERVVLFNTGSGLKYLH